MLGNPAKIYILTEAVRMKRRRIRNSGYSIIFFYNLLKYMNSVYFIYNCKLATKAILTFNRLILYVFKQFKKYKL